MESMSRKATATNKGKDLEKSLAEAGFVLVCGMCCVQSLWSEWLYLSM